MFGRSLAVTLALVALPLVGTARPADAAGSPGVRIWTSHGDTYRRGEAVRVFFRTENDAYVTIFRVDTDGRVRILFPRDPYDPNLAHGGETYTVDNVDNDDAFIVDDYPGVGYVFAVASADPFAYDPFTANDHWSLVQVANLSDGRIHGDPYASLDDLAHDMMANGYTDYDTHLLPYYVEQRYDYPRFLCYDCHAYVPYAYWDPYAHFCSRFSLFVYYDPWYFYPSYWYPTRYYGGTNVVYVRPRFAGSEYVFKAAGDRSGGTIVYRDRRGVGVQGGGPGDRGVRGVDLGGVGTIPAPGGGGRRTAGGGTGGGGTGIEPPGGMPGRRGGDGGGVGGGGDKGRGGDKGGGNDRGDNGRGRGTDPVTPPGRRFIGSPATPQTPANGPSEKVLRVESGAGRRGAEAPVRSTSDPAWIVGPDRRSPDVAPEPRRGVYIDPGTRPEPRGGATPQPEQRPSRTYINQGASQGGGGGAWGGSGGGGGGERRAAPQSEPRYQPPAAAGGGGGSPRYVPRQSAPPESRGYGAPSGGSAPRAAPSAPARGESRPAARGGAPTLIRRRP